MSSEQSTSVSTHILDTSLGRPAAGVGVRLSVRQGDEGAAWAAHGASHTDADGRCKDFPALPEGATHARLLFETEPYFGEQHSLNQHNLNQHSLNQNSPNPRSQREAAAQQDAPRVRDSAPGSFFPEVTITFAVNPGEHYHVPLLLNPFGYSVYRGS